MALEDYSILQIGADSTRLDFGVSGSKITEELSVAQRFVIFFLTQKNTVADSPLYGTDFVNEAISGVLRTETDVINAFNVAVVDMLNFEENLDVTGKASNEIFQAATLDMFEQLGSLLRLNVTVLTQSGSTIGVTIPVIRTET